MTRRWRLGAAALVVYAVAALVTLAGGHRVRPLFEGFAPPPAYQWVKPPPAFASSNITPRAGSTDIPLSGGASAARTASDPAAQFSVNFGSGAFEAHAADTSVHAAVTPLDPATLGPLPGGLYPDGNAYRIALSYQPSGTPVTKLALPGDAVVEAPQDGVVLLFSPDGRTWSRLATQFVSGRSTVGATFSAPGWFLVASNVPFGGAKAGGGSGTVIVAVGVGAAVVVLAVGGWILSHRRRPGGGARRRGPARPSGRR